MGFLGLRRPRWKHADPEVRLRALPDLGSDHQGIFCALAIQDPDPRVRAASASRIVGAADLQRMMKDGDDAVRRIARERLSGAADQLLRSKPLSEVGNLMDSIDDQKSLAELSVQASDPAVRATAFARLLALPEPSPALLALVAIQDADGKLAAQAVAKLERRATLKDVAKKAKSAVIRSAAQQRIDTLVAESERPSAERRRQTRQSALDGLLPLALKLAVSNDHAHSPEAWLQLTSRWDAALQADAELARDAAVDEADRRFRRARSDGELRRQAWLEQVAAAKAIGATVLAELEALAPEAEADVTAIAARFQPDSAVAEACTDLSTQIKQRLTALHALRLEQRQEQRSAQPAALVASLDSEVAAKLNKIGDEAEALAAAGDFEAKFRFQVLHKEWSWLAQDLDHGDPVASRFPAAYAAWKAKRQEEREERTSERTRRLAELNVLASEAEALATRALALGQDELRAHELALKSVEARWKAIGPVPANLVTEVRNRYRTALDAAWKPVGATREAEDWDRFTRLAHAEELITTVEALQAREDWSEIAHQVKLAHQQWKEIGALPRDRQQDTWLRFKAACDAQFDRCRPFFAEQDLERVANLERKRALIVEFEALAAQGSVGLTGSPADLAARKTASERAKVLQNTWKEIGPVPRADDRTTWGAWKTVCDRFWSTRRAELDARHEEHVANLNRKLALCIEAEDLAVAAEAAIADPTSGRPAAETSRTVRELQAIWKGIGHVPRERMDEIWNRWRTANDRIFAALKPHFAEQDTARAANATAKEAIIADLEDLATRENPHWFADDVLEAQGRWREIGHVPRERMDELSQRFEAVCSRILAAKTAAQAH